MSFFVRSRPFAFVCCAVGLACAHRSNQQDRSWGAAGEEAVFSEAVAVSFLHSSLQKVLSEDESLWDDVVDQGVFPPGFWRLFFERMDEREVNPWALGFVDVKVWLSTRELEDIFESVQLVDGLNSVVLSDYREHDFEEFAADSMDLFSLFSSGFDAPDVELQAVVLGLDFDGDSQISSKEKTAIYALEGRLFWEPFGW